MKKLLTDLTKEELASELSVKNLPKYRIDQIYGWLNVGVPFEKMSNLPRDLRAALDENYAAVGVSVLRTAVSKDGTVKFLFVLNDGNLIEGVLMKYKYGYTLCVSTQVGCRMGCEFCASGKDGLLRNLSAGEMLGEVICADKYLSEFGNGLHVGNVVLMGSGEPLDNYDNVTTFIKMLGEKKNIGQRSVSLSTCGLTENIKRLADDGFSITLCLSLHSPFDDRRVTVMPSGKKYKVADIISAAEYYFEKSGRRVIVEYAMMRGFNTRDEDVRELRRLTRNFPCHINLIPLNDTDSGLAGVNGREAKSLLARLVAAGASATIRRSLGEDIEGACGQLKRRYLSDESADRYESGDRCK